SGPAHPAPRADRTAAPGARRIRLALRRGDRGGGGHGARGLLGTDPPGGARPGPAGTAGRAGRPRTVCGDDPDRTVDRVAARRRERAMDASGAVIFWDVSPYVALAIMIVGLIWRCRYDKFGWTTRSSELYEARLLRIGSPLFHFGILVVVVGHIGGLVVPQSWTDALGISEDLYHFNALFFGSIAGLCTLAGIVILIY